MGDHASGDIAAQAEENGEEVIEVNIRIDGPGSSQCKLGLLNHQVIDRHSGCGAVGDARVTHDLLDSVVQRQGGGTIVDLQIIEHGFDQYLGGNYMGDGGIACVGAWSANTIQCTIDQIGCQCGENCIFIDVVADPVAGTAYHFTEDFTGLGNHCNIVVVDIVGDRVGYQSGVEAEVHLGDYRFTGAVEVCEVKSTRHGQGGLHDHGGVGVQVDAGLTAIHDHCGEGEVWLCIGYQVDTKSGFDDQRELLIGDLTDIREVGLDVAGRGGDDLEVVVADSHGGTHYWSVAYTAAELHPIGSGCLTDAATSTTSGNQDSAKYHCEDVM